MKLPKVDWIGARKITFLLSGALIAASLGLIFTKGFNYGVDFTGGSVVVITYEQPRQLEDLRADLKKAGYPDAQPQSFSGTNSFSILQKGEKGEQAQDARGVEALTAKLREVSPAFRVDRKEFVGPTVGRHLKKQAATAIILAIAAIILYVAFRFDNPIWGAAGVAAIFHDVTILAGVFSLIGKEIDLVIVAAFLTIAGYSINDTIVIFDRMREILRTRRMPDIGEIANEATNEMMSRTVITNCLVLTVVGVLFVFGGTVIHDFAFAMLVGSVLGTYSTVGVSIPLLYVWTRKAPAHEPRPAGKAKQAGRK